VDKKEQFTAAISSNEGLIFRIAALYTNTAEDKHDLAQEIIYQLWKSFDSFSNHAALSTWMYRVAMNTAISQLKVAKRKIRTVPMDDQPLHFHETYDREKEERWEMIRQQLNQLNLLDKGIVLLYLENKSYEEIAAIVGISASNVGTKLNRIKEKLKQQIAKQQ
jgi:RNA polymerase sigma factor (sigma-70 family)